MEYKVISSITIEGLEKVVNAHLLQGWKAQGGIAKSVHSFYQALVRTK